MVLHPPNRETRIPGVKQHEDPEFILWRHWFIPVTGTVVFVLLLVLPFIVWHFVSSGIKEQISATGWDGVVTVLFVMYIMFIWLVYITFFIDYYLDTWIVTNQRIIDIEQKGLFRRVVSQHHLVRVQDVTSDIHGIVHTLLNFGNVHIQTAGSRERFQFSQVPRPNAVKQRIIQLHKQAVSRLTPEQRKRLATTGTPYTTAENGL